MEREHRAHGQGSRRRQEAAPACHEDLSQFYRVGKGASEMQDECGGARAHVFATLDPSTTVTGVEERNNVSKDMKIGDSMKNTDLFTFS